jgi:hypothetical protein
MHYNIGLNTTNVLQLFKNLIKIDTCIKTMKRTKLTYKERIQWFVNNHYETGMEYYHIYEQFKNKDLDNIDWIDGKVKIPKYKDEL